MTNDFHSEHEFEEATASAAYQTAELSVQELPVDELTMAELSAHTPPVARPEAVECPADTLVAFQAGLIFVTTGEMACTMLGADLDQIALTPTVAWRISNVLREILQLPQLDQRMALVEAWNAHEAASMPSGRITVHDHCLQIGIEPLGAGARVTVGWNYVAGLIVSLEAAADWAQGVR